MRLQLVLCLCLWIPVAQSFGVHAPEDQDGSGDDEFSGSGSGSGDFEIWFSEPEVTYQANPNTTKTPWITDAPVNLPEHSVTPFVNPDTETETSDHVSEALLPHTTQIMETQPSLFISKSFGSVEDQKGETTAISTVAPQPETTVPPAVKVPVVPTQEDEYTTAAKEEEDTTESSVTEQEIEETTVVESVSVTTAPPDMETTPLLLSTASPSDLADTEASGDSVEVTTVQGIGEDFSETNIIPEDREHVGKPRLNDHDFEFENEIQTVLNSDVSGSGSDFARGSASDNDSLLERKEVLAGVIAGGVVGLAFAIMLVALMVYRMKKKDEGSYSLDEHKHPNGGYQKPQKQEEFLA
ncbi:syndecan-1 [Tachysurus fulvidraco]|uniref:syndecan-1 n=1 Tax=Tachysurus fulvidraco TaxID=1234273 RepID=UPI000F4E0842|nr:syndecan-1 [Tachysurus fulvidraco]